MVNRRQRKVCALVRRKGKVQSASARERVCIKEHSISKKSKCTGDDIASPEVHSCISKCADIRAL